MNRAQRRARAAKEAELEELEAPARPGTEREGRWFSDPVVAKRWRCGRCGAIVDREKVSQHAWDAHHIAIDSLRPREGKFRPIRER